MAIREELATTRPTPDRAAALAELEALETPEGVDAATFAELKAELARIISTSARTSSDIEEPYYAFTARPREFQIVWANDTGRARWRCWNPGDYDQNGEVAVSDIVPLGVFLNSREGDPNWDIAKVADGDENGEVNVSDLQPIGANLGQHVDGFKLELMLSPRQSGKLAAYVDYDVGQRQEPYGPLQFESALNPCYTGDQYTLEAYYEPGKASGVDRMLGRYEEATVPEGVGPWPQYGHDAQRTRRSTLPAPRNPQLAWVKQVSQVREYGPLVEVSGNLYGERLDTDGQLYVAGFDADGQTQWSLPLSFEPTIALPLAGERFLLSGYYSTAILSTSGELLWSEDDNSPYFRYIAPDGTVYFGLYGEIGGIAKLEPGGQQLETIIELEYGSIHSMAVDGDAIYACYSAAPTLSELQAYSLQGEMLWSVEPCGELYAHPLGGVLNVNYPLNTSIDYYSASGELQYSMSWIGPDGYSHYFDYRVAPAISADGHSYWNAGGNVIAFDPSGDFQWYAELPAYNDPQRIRNLYPYDRAGVRLSTDGELVLAADTNFLCAFDLQGQQLWRRAFTSPLNAPLFSADGGIIAACEDGNVYRLDRNGTQLSRWQRTLSQDYSTGVEPVASRDGSIYLQCSDHLQQVYTDGTSCMSFDPGDRYLANLELNGAGSLLAIESYWNESRVYEVQREARYGGFGYSDDNPMDFFFSPLYVYGGRLEKTPAIAPDGTIIVLDETGILLGLEPDGKPAWGYISGKPKYTMPAVAPDGTVYACGLWGDLVSLSPAGKLNWSADPWVGFPHLAVGDDGTVYLVSSIGNDDRQLLAYNPDGTLKWEAGTYRSASEPGIAPNGGVILCCKNQATGGDAFSLVAVSSGGEQLWSVPLAYDDITPPVIDADGTILVGARGLVDDAGVAAVLAFTPDGSELWRFELPEAPLTAPVIVAPGRIVTHCTDGNLYCLSD